ncbi:MAG: FAD/NAD(P)-binding oxidoreductase, partial [Solirubrobacteraceae bacterium]
MSGPVICVVGAGTAGLEGLLYAREALGPDAELRLIAPDRDFRYRPMSEDSLFRPAAERRLAVADVVSHAGATWIVDRAEVIRESERSVLTRNGDTVGFDYLLLTPGARQVPALRQGHVWQRGGDPGFLDQIISGLRAGTAHTVAVVVPEGARWPLPAYELALVLAWTAAGTGARITLLTAEQRPLGVLGAEATRVVTEELDDAGVTFISGTAVADDPAGAPPDRIRVHCGAGSPVAFDQLISLPTVLGPHITGVATDAAGFIEVDGSLLVCGSERVWAAGDCVASALDHSALAARQADA